VVAVLGEPTDTGVSPECPFGPAEYATFPQIGLAFAEDVFVGWSGGADPSLRTVEGIGVGSTRAELEAIVTVIIDTESTIEGIWGGLVCIYR
jgi:hypothetical protein